MERMLPAGMTLGQMHEDEVTILEGWAADEGWNPGLADCGIAWATDPQAFIALRKGSELLGGGAIISYGGRLGFMGLFIIRTDMRGQGLGATLWQRRLELLRERLAPETAIGMDGVFDMVPFYERGGFRLLHRDLRFEGIAHGEADGAVISISDVPFREVAAFDARNFGAPREPFLERWLGQPDAHTAAVREQGDLVGYGVIRPCRRGFKLGPVFADRPDIAERLVGALMNQVEGEFVQLDVPEPNEAGLELAARFGLSESFGCARMVNGPDPAFSVGSIFGVTSFEFG